ncbi:MAG TPA: hypothetical protein VGQ55_07360, partial [Pyrinomonadaceae bacterium]|nr:hypothetical protein [Pyrinomonadaceae bacterium]
SITSYLHSDSAINLINRNIFEFEPGKTSLIAEIVGPEGAEAKVETNYLTAPGRPGSVDKGEREERGVRLAVTTTAPVDKAKFITRLRIERKR